MADISLNNVLINGANAANSVAESWNGTWQDVLGLSGAPGGATLYSSLCWVGTVFAVGTLIFLMIELFKDLNEGKEAAFAQLIWPLIVALLLASNGTLLARITVALRDIINEANTQVISATMAGVKLDELYQEANGNIGLQSMISSYMRPCQSLTGEAQVQCLNQAVAQAQGLVDAYKAVFGDKTWLENIQSFLSSIGDILTGGGDPMGIFGLTKPLWMPIVVSILYWMQIAFQNLLEGALIITALLGPVAVGGSLLPFGAKPIFAWLTGFFSVGFARLSFNIIVGLTSVVATSSEGGDPFWFALFAGLFAPILAMSLASGAGLAVWTAVSSAVGNAAKLTIGLIA